MKFLPLILRNLLRRKVRTTFTILSIVVAFVLFGFLMTIRAAFAMGVDLAGAEMLNEVRRQVLPAMQKHGPIVAWIVDDTGFRKQGKDSVGVARQ